MSTWTLDEPIARRRSQRISAKGRIANDFEKYYSTVKSVTSSESPDEDDSEPNNTTSRSKTGSMPAAASFSKAPAMPNVTKRKRDLREVDESGRRRSCGQSRKYTVSDEDEDISDTAASSQGGSDLITPTISTPHGSIPPSDITMPSSAVVEPARRKSYQRPQYHEFRNFFDRHTYADVNIKVGLFGAKEVQCHKIILASESQWFAQHFEEIGRNGSVLWLDWRDDEQAIRAMLEWMYTFDYMVATQSKAERCKWHIRIYKTAIKYKVDRLAASAFGNIQQLLTSGSLDCLIDISSVVYIRITSARNS